MRLVCLVVCLSVSTIYADTPNVTVIVADDMGWSDMSRHGGPLQTPAMDTLFAEGIELTQFHTCPVCHPTRFAFLTGLNGGTGQYLYGRKYQMPDIDNIAHAFHDAGYYTAVFGKWDFSDNPPTDRGFDVFVPSNTEEHTIGDRYETYVIPELVAALPEPYFALCTFTVPHDPPVSPPEFRTGDTDHDQYDGMVRALDDAVQHIPRNGITFFFSDNGAQALGRTNPYYRGRKHSIELGGVVCPAAIHGLGQGTNEQLISVLDVWTTLASLCDGVRPGGYGINFLTDDRTQIFYTKGNAAAWRNYRWHYIKQRDGIERLYDILADPKEHNNLLQKPKYQQTLRNCRQKFNYHLSRSYYPLDPYYNKHK